MDLSNYREVMGHYPTGVVVVSGLVEDEPIGMVAGTFSAVSMEPPLVSFMPMKSSSSYGRLSAAPSLCISVLGHDQVDTCRTLAGKDPDKFDRAGWRISQYGAPAIDDAVAYVHCTLDQQLDAGDHWITLCAVTEMEVNRPVPPLLFFQGGYCGFTTRDMTAMTPT